MGISFFITECANGFILNQNACAFVFIFTSVEVETEPKFVCSVRLALQPSESEHSAACVAFLRKGDSSGSHVASVSFCLKEEGSYFSKLLFVSVECVSGSSGLQFSVTGAEMIQS